MLSIYIYADVVMMKGVEGNDSHCNMESMGKMRYHLDNNRKQAKCHPCAPS